MTHPTVYHVSPQQVGGEDLQEYLRKAVRRQFDGKEFYVAKELIEEKVTHYSSTPRKLRIFLVNENNSVGHAIWFDVTECSAGVNWMGR